MVNVDPSREIVPEPLREEIEYRDDPDSPRERDPDRRRLTPESEAVPDRDKDAVMERTPEPVMEERDRSLLPLRMRDPFDPREMTPPWPVD
jgi:hypothetical protein